MKYTIIIEKGRESGFVAYALALKGCVSQGKTMEVYVEALLENRFAVPTEVAINARL
ncbi:MAG: type II toxin-antitoxin system HicB family antitoxin [Chloroflexi bacterium]|nr:type II toxin-antitoxin system HicB family antitoxin [Chloroflexota bacterium]